MRKLILIAAAVALLAPTGLVAQRGRAGARRAPATRFDAPGFDGRGPGMGLQRMGVMPHMLVRMRARLELTDEQVSQLEALADGVEDAHQQARGTIREHEDQLREAMEADQPDVSALETHSRAIMEARLQAQVAALTAVARAKALLTEEQRGRVEGWLDARGGPRGMGMRQGRPDRAPARRFRRF